jgi:vancomycin resistance protein VanW
MMNSTRRLLRRALPQPLRLYIATSRRRFRDRLRGDHLDMIGAGPSEIGTEPFYVAITLTQPIRKSAHWEGKVHNLRLAASRLNGVALPPGRLLSFWQVIGQPCEKAGFLLGRSIRSDQVQADVGGGLCQISGLLYELGLRAGMKIVERHPHTQDLYAEHERFTPLGMDATVVWGYKDLRLRNILEQSVVFGFTLTEDWIEGTVRASRRIAPSEIIIERRDQPNCRRHVRVHRDSAAHTRELVSDDIYVGQQQPLDLSSSATEGATEAR